MLLLGYQQRLLFSSLYVNGYLLLISTFNEMLQIFALNHLYQ